MTSDQITDARPHEPNQKVEPPDVSAKTGNQSIAMAVRLLDELASSGHELGVTELAKRLAEQKGRVHRHLATLRSFGLVSQTEAGERYRLGWKILQLGIAASQSLDLPVLARRHTEKLRDETNETVVVAVPAGGNALAIDCLPSEAPVAVVVKKGVVFQVNTSSLGRTLLAFASPELQEAVLRRPMKRHTDFSVVDPAKLAARLQVIRQRYFEIAINEDLYGVGAMAAPIFDQRDQIVAAVGLVGSQFHFTEGPSSELVSKLQLAASAISSDLNSRAWENWRASGQISS